VVVDNSTCVLKTVDEAVRAGFIDEPRRSAGEVEDFFSGAGRELFVQKPYRKVIIISESNAYE
jgi:hypothetical protein